MTSKPATRHPSFGADWFGCYDVPRTELFTRDSNRHPAKMAVGLCFRIIEHGERMGYWQKGDLLLDPMCGIGTTLVCGLVSGYSVRGVELEEHFWLLCNQNMGHVSRWIWPGCTWRVERGDARYLPALLLDHGAGPATGGITSPPYGGRDDHGADPHPEKMDGPGTMFRGYDATVSSAPYTNEGLGHGPDTHPERTHSPQPANSYAGGITSPPYADRGLPSMVRAEIRQLAKAGKWDEAIALMREVDREDCQKGNRRAPHSDEYLRIAIEQAIEREQGGYGARAPSGVVSSPPYSDQSVIAGAGMTGRILRVAREQGIEVAIRLYRATVMDTQKAHGRWSDENIRKHIELALATEDSGYSAVINSPPYPSAFREEHPGTEGGAVAQENQRGGSFRGYADGDDGRGTTCRAPTAQIGNLRDPKGDIDAVLSSPPWEKGARGGLQGWAGNSMKAAAVAAERYATGERRGHPASAAAIEAQMQRDEARTYGDSPGQIGTTAGETYLSAMLQVYRGMWEVLRPGGVVALVTKNPVKKGAIRRLDLDTIRLMAAAGFELLERKRSMLAEEHSVGHLFGADTVIRRERKSFFKRLFEKKRPDLRVDHEDVLFFRKLL
jgi:hypothetical protein